MLGTHRDDGYWVMMVFECALRFSNYEIGDRNFFNATDNFEKIIESNNFASSALLSASLNSDRIISNSSIG